MLTVFLLSLCCGPLLVAACSLLLISSSASTLQGSAAGIVAVVVIMLTLQLLSATGVSVVYRWSFARPAVRGAGMLAASLVSVFALSHEQILQIFAGLIGGGVQLSNLASQCLLLVVEGGTVLGVALSACMVGMLVFEVPLRWVQGDQALVSDGVFRMLRVAGVIILWIACSAIMREQGVVRLIALLKRVIA